MLIVLLLLAQAGGMTGPDPSRVTCSTVDGPIRLGQDPVTVQLKCCPEDFFVYDPTHPTDKQGNLVCVRGT